MSDSEERGAGGKLMRQSARKRLPTPYARPQQNQGQRSRWISRLVVDPAWRVVTGGATKLIPYFFSKWATPNALPAPIPEDEDRDEIHMDLEQHATVDSTPNLNLAESKLTELAGPSRTRTISSSYLDFSAQKGKMVLTEEAGPSRTEDSSKSHFDLSADRGRMILTEEAGPSRAGDSSKSDLDLSAQKGKMVLTDDDGLSAIKNLIEGKCFSRGEVDRLIEIMRSRAVDPNDVEQKKKNVEINREEAEQCFVSPEITQKAAELKHGNVDTPRWSTPSSVLKSTATELKHGNVDTPRWATPSSALKSTMAEEVSPSPIDIAKAYMGNRTSQVNLGSKDSISKDERASLHHDKFTAKYSVTSASPNKASPRWPGAVLQDHSGYATPRSQRGGFGLHNFPRTPYSRSIFSKSTSKLSKLQDDSNMRPNIFSSPFQQLQSPLYEQSRSSSKATAYEHGSVGPIRRTRHKTGAETPRGSSYSRSMYISSEAENSNDSTGLFRNSEKNGTMSFSTFQPVDGKPKRSEWSTPTVHPHSSQVARTILEHLERPATPKDKSAELKLVTSWRKSQSSDVLGNNSLSDRALDFPKKVDQADKNNLTKFNEYSENSLFKVPKSVPKAPSNSATERDYTGMKKTTSALNVTFGGPVTRESNNAKPSFELQKQRESQINDTLKDPVKGVPQKPPPHSPGTKPILSSISVGKPMQSWTGFTFPVSSSSGGTSEPPTPSIMPTSPPLVTHQKKEEDTGPLYSFGAKSSTSPLVFSFPSKASSSSAHVGNKDDTSDIKFSFGSGEPRISFGSAGKDAVCC